MALPELIARALATIGPRLGARPEAAVVLGSGLSGCAEAIELECAIDFADIPGMRASTAPGHLGRLLFGRLAGRQVVCMQGRLHYYEGLQPTEVVFPIQVMRALGAQTLIVTNAAGAINTGFAVGDIMSITDHINLTGGNPLTWGEETGLADCLDMSYCYTPALRDLTNAVAQEQGLALHQGVYLGVRGPNFETPAEIRAFRALGADAVGMSTVLEVIQAVQLGMDVIGLSMITNMGAGITGQRLGGDDVLRASLAAAAKMEGLIIGILHRLG
ncbi:MAG: purine-nucleoside phosphorylase [Coriobacteriia bacterium]|nr:purine-nucleoside phosphorylase [Coriobacteriia bacterium]